MALKSCKEISELMEAGLRNGSAQDEKSEYHDFDGDPSESSTISSFEQPETVRYFRDFNLQIPSGRFLSFEQLLRSKTTSFWRHSIDW